MSKFHIKKKTPSGERILQHHSCNDLETANYYLWMIAANYNVDIEDDATSFSFREKIDNELGDEITFSIVEDAA